MAPAIAIVGSRLKSVGRRIPETTTTGAPTLSTVTPNATVYAPSPSKVTGYKAVEARKKDSGRAAKPAKRGGFRLTEGGPRRICRGQSFREKVQTATGKGLRCSSRQAGGRTGRRGQAKGLRRL